MTDNDDITRKKASRTQTSMVVWVLMAMLITGLGGFGVTNFGRSVTAIGSVGDREIDADAYARALRSQINRLSQQFGQQLSLAEARMFGVDAQVLSGLVANAALDNEAGRIGLSVGDLSVARRVATDQAFHDVTGKFSASSYKLTLDQAGLSVRAYETGLRADIARTVLQAAVVGGMVAPAALTDTLVAYAGETRGFSVLQFSEASLTTRPAAPTDAEVQAFYDAHLDAFTRPEAKRISYVALTPADLAAAQTIDEAAVQELYQSRIADYVVPEKRLVERLVYPNDAEAAAARARLDAGEAFETLVTDRGLELTDIDLGDVGLPELGAAGAAVFALTGPGVVGPLPSDLGPALYRMNAILAAQETTLAQVHDELAAELRTAAAVRAIADQAAAVDDALAGGATLDDLVRDHGMTLATTDYVAGASDNDPIAADRAFATAADALAIGDYPEALQLTDGGLAALRLDELVPPAPVPLDKIRDRVATATAAAQLAAALTAEASAAQAAVTAGGTMAAQGPLTVIAPITRDAPNEATTPAVVKAAFEMAVGDTRLIDTADFIGLIRLDSVTPVDLAAETTKAAREALAAQSQQGTAQDAYDLFTAAMTAQGGLTIDQSVITAVQAQLN